MTNKYGQLSLHYFKLFSQLFVQYIGFIIIIFSVIAFFQPEYFKWMTKYIAIFLGVAMFGMGTSIKGENFKSILKHPREVIIGCVAQFTIMPLAAYLLAVVFKLPVDLALGVILVGCCPGGTASNVITYIARGNVSLSVAMTILSTLVAPLVTPVLIYCLAGQWLEISLWGMMQSVISVVLIPIILGMVCKKWMGNIVEKGSHIFPLISSLAIVLIIAGIIAANTTKIISSGGIVFSVVILHNLIGLMGGLLIGRILNMDYDKETALAIEVGMQNSGLAISLATIHFVLNPLATLPGAIFSIWHNISGSIFANYRRQKAKIISLPLDKVME